MTGFPRRGVYALTRDSVLSIESLLEDCELALRGGVCVIQYRDKANDLQTKSEFASALVSLCHDYDVPCIINDHPQLVIEAQADGVHLGQNDTPYKDARKMLGPDRLIGVSCYSNVEKAQQAARAGADYIAFGSFFPSQTKPHAPPCPLEVLNKQVPCPTVAIGGINSKNGQKLVDAGADLLAISAAIFTAPDRETAARRCADIFKDQTPLAKGL
ncbi:MAG: thiamine phosphate synthase [Pseudomonadota bacterium]